jgi:DNA helicase-2/ATP-dependent DNA helicase PcrA
MTKQFILKGSPVSSGVSIDYQKELNAEQLDVVLHGDDTCLVLAGAGSGKTRTITYRVAYLVEHGVHPTEILLLTFTNRSAHEMRDRAERLLGTSIDGMWAGTFHSIANRILRSYADRIGFDRSFTILDTEDSKSLIKQTLKELKIDTTNKRFPSPNVCLNILSFTRNVCGSIMGTLETKYPDLIDLEPDFMALAGRYAERKRAGNAMDFDDLLIHLLELLELPDIGEQISKRFRYVLVDEYQDTNVLQARIVNRFSSPHGNMLVVGDDAQSIYGFRGADIQNILNIPYEYPGAKIYKLLTNYRSTPEILALANDSLSHNTDQYQKELVGLRGGGEKPFLVPTASAHQEAQYIAEQIVALRERGAKASQIAVLFRATSHSQQLEMELLKRGIAYEYRGGLKLFERAHIKDVVSFLRVQHNPKDDQAWKRLLLMQTGIGDVMAEKLSQTIIQAESLQTLLSSPMTLTAKVEIGWDALRAILLSFQSHETNPSELIRAVASSSYQLYLEREHPNWRDRLEDIEQFAVFAEQYKDLTSFLGDVMLYDDVFAMRAREEKHYDEERIILSTVHQAKGLEWDTVFIIHLADGSFPNKRALMEDNGVEEERRLFYVAVTRARKALYLSYPLTTGMDALVLNRPSQFIDEVDPHLLERVELVSPSGYGKPPRKKSWSWDDGDAGYEDEVIELDAQGNRKNGSTSRFRRPSSPPVVSKTVWKKGP